MKPVACLFAFTLTLLSATSSFGQTLFQDLLPRVPEDANALVLIHSEKLRASAFARDFAAKTLRGNTQGNKHLVATRDVERVVLAAELTSVQLTPAWEIAVMQTNTSPSFDALQARGEGQTETLGNLAALRMNTNAYLIALAPKLYGVFGPANRQKAARWAERSQTATENRLTPYLAKIAEYPETAGTEIMMAFDAAGMVEIDRVRGNLKASETLKAYSRVDHEALAQVLAGIQGVALGIKATDVLNAKLRVDFAGDPRVMKDFAKPLLLEKLGDMGLMIDELENWQATVDAHTVYLSGELSAGGLRKVLSLIDPPTFPADKPATTSESSASDLDPLAMSSQRYFNEIEALLNDMHSTANRKYVKQAGWYDRNARKVGQFSMVNVDPELLDFGLAVSTAFRSMAFKLRNQAAEASQYSFNSTSSWNVYGDWYNGYITTHQTQPSERAKAEKMSKMYGTMSYADTVQSIGNATSEMRRRMVERYKIDF